MGEMKYKVGDVVRTTAENDKKGNKLFPVGTIGTITEICDCSIHQYKVEAYNDYWYYSDDMLEPAQEDNSGWAIARDIVIRYSDNQLEAIFGDKYNGRSGILANFTESEAREAIERWKESTVVFGDIIEKEGKRFIVTHLDNHGFYVVDNDGATGYVPDCAIKSYKRTGRNLSIKLAWLLAALDGEG